MSGKLGIESKPRIDHMKQERIDKPQFLQTNESVQLLLQKSLRKVGMQVVLLCQLACNEEFVSSTLPLS